MTDGSIDRARALLAAHPVIDGHNDLAWELRKRVRYDFDRLDIARPQPEVHTDIPRLRAGGVGAQFWSVYVPSKLHGDQAVRALAARAREDLVERVERLLRDDGARFEALLDAAAPEADSFARLHTSVEAIRRAA